MDRTERRSESKIKGKKRLLRLGRRVWVVLNKGSGVPSSTHTVVSQTAFRNTTRAVQLIRLNDELSYLMLKK